MVSIGSSAAATIATAASTVVAVSTPNVCHAIHVELH
jgi:hypothetical protein